MLWDYWGDERGCDEGHWHAHTRGLQWGLPEVVGMVQQVHCSWRRLLRRGLEFHVCTINKSAHTKMSGNLCVYIYIYIYTYIYICIYSNLRLWTGWHTMPVFKQSFSSPTLVALRKLESLFFYFTHTLYIYIYIYIYILGVFQDKYKKKNPLIFFK